MNSRIEQVNWGLLGTTILGLLLAAFLGITIADSDYDILLYLAAFFAFILYVAYFQRFTWQIALFLCYLGLSYRPTGFDFGPIELTCGLGALLAATTVWQKRPRQRLGVLAHRSFTVVRWFLLLWVLYVAIHMIYTIANPLRPSEFFLKNALKSYFTPFVPAIMLWYFSGSPTGIRTKDNIMRTLAILLLVGVVFNFAVVVYGLIFGSGSLDLDSSYSYTGTLFIPGLNARDNPYMLRTLGPAAVLFGAITLNMGRTSTGVSRMLSACLVLLGCVGSLVSGGRAAVTIAVFLVAALLVLRKRFLLLFLFLIAGGLFILLVNLSADWVNRKAPLAISRPLQWTMVNKSNQALGTIQSSSLWRRGLFEMAIAEWRSVPRIFWFGRATYGFGVADTVARDISGGYKAGMESSLRRGATHNLISDLLVSYGLIGGILYYCVIFALLRFLWIVHRSRELPRQARPLSLLCLITTVGYIGYASIGGGFLPIDLVWLLIIFIAALYRHQPQKLAEEHAPSLSVLERHAA